MHERQNRMGSDQWFERFATVSATAKNSNRRPVSRPPWVAFQYGQSVDACVCRVPYQSGERNPMRLRTSGTLRSIP